VVKAEFITTMAEKGILEFKVVVLGDKGVGKTCLVLRFIEV
jgi:GTPase SAR1 family protein